MNTYDLKPELNHEILTREQEEAIGNEIEGYRLQEMEILGEIGEAKKIIERIKKRAHEDGSEVELLDIIATSEDMISQPSQAMAIINEQIHTMDPISEKNLGRGVMRIIADTFRGKLVEMRQSPEKEALVSEEIGVSLEKLQSVMLRYDAVDRQLTRAEHFVIAHNMRLVMKMVRQIGGKTSASTEDLVQEGNMGLMKAVDRFDWKRGYKFATYAVYWINTYVRKAAHEQHGSIKVPVHQVDVLGRISRVRAELKTENGGEPTIADISERSGISENRIRSTLSNSISSVSLDQPVSDDGNATMSEIIEDPRSSHVMETDSEQFVNALLGRSDHSTRMAMSKRYAMPFPDDMSSLQEAFNLHKVQKKEGEAIARLKAMCGKKEKKDE